MPDHVHLVLSQSKNIALANLLMHIKKDSSKWFKTIAPGLTRFGWQDGYAGFSVSESGLAALRAYIANQKEHHRQQSFQDELREFLKKYDVPYDERYVWD